MNKERIFNRVIKYIKRERITKFSQQVERTKREKKKKKIKKIKEIKNERMTNKEKWKRMIKISEIGWER